MRNGKPPGMVMSWRGLTALACGLGAPTLAQAVPAGLAPGSTYRLAFVTDGTIDALGTAAKYNSFVSTEAAAVAGLPTTTWTAIVSTNAVNAIDNIACTPSCAADPIYLVSGAEVASSTANLFSGSLMNAINLDGAGAAQNFTYVWTGSNTSGTALNPLGPNGTFAEVGFTGDAGGLWINSGTNDKNVGRTPITHSLYAISNELVVPGSTPVPEPMTLSLLSLGVLGAAGARRAIRRRAHPAMGLA